ARRRRGAERVRRLSVLSILGLVLACGTPATAESPPARGAVGAVGVASWYGADFQGNPTASGERLDARALTAAHPSLPPRTRVRVTNLANGRSVVVRVTDRGPFVCGRMIDVSSAAARSLGMVESGTARVQLIRLDGAAGPEARSVPTRPVS